MCVSYSLTSMRSTAETLLSPRSLSLLARSSPNFLSFYHPFLFPLPYATLSPLFLISLFPLFFFITLHPKTLKFFSLLVSVSLVVSLCLYFRLHSCLCVCLGLSLTVSPPLFLSLSIPHSLSLTILLHPSFSLHLPFPSFLLPSFLPRSLPLLRSSSPEKEARSPRAPVPQNLPRI